MQPTFISKGMLRTNQVHYDNINKPHLLLSYHTWLVTNPW